MKTNWRVSTIVGLGWLLAGGSGGHCGVSSDGLRPAGTECPAGRADCNAAAADGCEAVLASDHEHCGACDLACPADQECTAGSCQPLSCVAPLADCNHQVADGCETVLASDHEHCGTCDRACPADQVCASGACRPLSCAAPTADCDHLVADGCEIDLSASNEHCGACDHACAAQELCAGGTCLPVLARSSRSIKLLGADDGYVYWSTEPTRDDLGNRNADGAVARAPITGGTAEALASGLDYYFYCGPLMNGSALYWQQSAAAGDVIWTVPKAGGAVSMLASLGRAEYPSMPRMTDVDDTAVFMDMDVEGSADMATDVLQIRLSAPESPVLLAHGAPYSFHLGADGSNLYYTGSVVRKTDGTVTRDGRLWAASNQQGYVVSADVPYLLGQNWDVGSPSMVLEIPADPLASAIIIEEPAAAAGPGPYIATSADSVLWLAGTAGGFEVHRMILGSRTVRTEARGAGSAQLVAHGNDVYLAIEGPSVGAGSAIVKYTLSAP